jgi:3-methylfumaryl-CoA hydratase
VTQTLYAEYLGRQERRIDTLDERRLADLAAFLDVDYAALVRDHRLPPLAHWFYFNPWVKHSELGPDGHTRRGAFMPPITLPRRMFAGARLVFHCALDVGAKAERVATIASIREKAGASGELIFVTVRHEISANGVVAIEEEQDIVYRGDAPPGKPVSGTSTPAPVEPLDAYAFRRRVEPNPVLLFRFSALLGNAHRIHYDRPYATETESYPGLLVHGPLQALLLMDLVREHFPNKALARFSFQARRPLFDTAPFECAARANGSAIDLKTLDADGRACTVARAELR